MNAFHQTTWNAFFPSSLRFFPLSSELTSAIFFYLCKTHTLSTKCYLGMPSNPGKRVYMGQLSTHLAGIPALFAKISARWVTCLSHINSEPAKQYFNIVAGISPWPSNSASRVTRIHINRSSDGHHAISFPLPFPNTFYWTYFRLFWNFNVQRFNWRLF